MSKALPAIVVLLGVPAGMAVGSYLAHITMGSLIGGGLGFIVGLVLLIRKTLQERP